MNLTEKQLEALNVIKDFYKSQKFSAKILSDKSGKKISGNTLFSLSKKGILESFDTEPKTYLLLEGTNKAQNNEIKEGRNPALDLFNLLNTIESDVQSIIHWMRSDTYATEAGTQIGIYCIKDVKTKDIVYVGKTERPFQERWKEHRQLLESGIHHSPRLQEYFDSLNKDFSKISFEILQELPHDSKIIDLRERFWIEKYENTILNFLKPKLKK